MTSTDTAAADAALTSESADPVSAPKPSRKRPKAISEADKKPAKPQFSVPASNKKSGDFATPKAPAAGGASDVRPERPRQTKGSVVEALLTREGGVSLEALCEATGWQKHTCRALLTGLRKKGREVIRASDKDGKSIYLIAPDLSPASPPEAEQAEAESH
jgi:hypothetical protein